MKYINPQQGKQTAQANARKAVGDIHFKKWLLPGRTRSTEDIAAVEPKSPCYTDYKATEQGNQKIDTGKQPQCLQAPQTQIIYAQIHQRTAESYQRKQKNLYHPIPLPSLKYA